jgi:hypothetical protein
MKCKLLFFGASVLLISIITPRSAQAEFYVVDSNHDFGTLNPVTGVFTHIANTDPIFASLAVTPNRTLYGEAYDGNLYTINPATGATTLVGNTLTPPFINPVFGLAAQSDTNLLGFIPIPVPSHYGSIQASSGTFTQLGQFPNESSIVGSGTLAFGPGGALFYDTVPLLSGFSGQAILYTVNPANGNLTQIGSNLGTGGDALSLVYDGTHFYGIDTFSTTDIGIYNVDATTGTATRISTLTGLQPGQTEDAIVFIPSVPEPSTLTLLGIGAVCSLGYGWRRRRQSA